MNLKSILSLFASLFLTLGVSAQTADEILGKHLEAIGGHEAMDKIKSAVIESEISVAGNVIPTTTTIVYGKGFKSVSSFNGMEIIQCITDTSGWSLNPLTGQSEPEPMTAEQVKLSKGQLIVGAPVNQYKERGYSAELLGREDVEGVSTYKIKMTKPDEPEITVFIDPNSYYLLRLDVKGNVNGQDVENTTTFSDFRKSDLGYVMPYTTNTTNMGYELTINHVKVEFNKEIDPKIFAMQQ